MIVNIVKWSFSVGHVFNDLCSSMWFLFTMPYFTKVLRMENTFAGDVILIGQVADAIATPLIGIESDRVGIICHRKIGQRKSWHLLGTILCAISFPFIFHSFFQTPSDFDYRFMIVYYTPFVVIFQIAWAIVQITHLSLIPILMKLGQDNSSLNSLRYMFTVAANVVVLSATTVLFNLNVGSVRPNFNTTSSSLLPSDVTLNPTDQLTFTYLTIGVVALGLLFSLLFHLGVPERSADDESINGDGDKNISGGLLTPLLGYEISDMTISDWFKEPQFYLINALYLVTRLIVNVSQVYLILYIVDALHMSKIISSLAALTTFTSGAVTSFTLKRIQRKIGKKICYLFGLIVIMGYVLFVAFANSSQWQLYLSMVLLGMGSSIIMIGSLSLTAELIGESCSSGAFVYGSMSFSDKMFCGIVIWLMQRFGPSTQDCSACNQFYRNIELYFIGGCAVCALVILLMIYPMKIGQRWRHRHIVKSNSESSIEAANS